MDPQTSNRLDGKIVAREALAAIDAARQIPPFSERDPAFGIDRAYAAAAELRRLRTQRGERQVGRKIGFTNCDMWERFNVCAPVWGDMYDTTVQDLPSPGTLSLSRFVEPRIEPEIVFKLSADIGPELDDAGMLDAIAWVAHGFEIVQSIYPGWRFRGVDTIAANGVHGALLVGQPHPLTSLSAANVAEALALFEVTLSCNGETIDRGKGSNVLGGPLLALRHLAEVLASDPINPPLRAGEIVTTGTLTLAHPVAPGQTWTSEIKGLPLKGLTLTFT
jgi:2-oxo-3-hexenedioate decarboxylase